MAAMAAWWAGGGGPVGPLVVAGWWAAGGMPNGPPKWAARWGGRPTAAAEANAAASGSWASDEEGLGGVDVPGN